MALHRKGPLLGDEPLPGQGPGPLEEGVEAVGREAAQADEHPLAGAQVQVGPGDVPGLGGAQHPAVFRLDLFKIQTAQLVGAQSLQPEKGGDGQGEMFQGSFLLFV